MDGDALPPVADMLLALGGLTGDDALDALDDAAGGVLVDRIQVAFPAELDVFTAAGRVVAIGGSPPTQYTETTIMPQFHHLKLTLGPDDERQD